MSTPEIDTGIAKITRFWQAGDNKRAEFELGQLLIRNPGSALVMAAAADFYYQNCNMRQALPYARKALETVGPDAPLEEVLYLSKIMCCIGEDEAANALARNYLSAKQCDRSQIAKLADHFLNLDLIEESVGLFNSVGEQHLDDFGMAMYGTAKLYAGDVSGARQVFINACRRNPGNAIAALQLAMLNVAEGRQERIAAWEGLCLTPISDSDRSHLLFALFHEYDALGDKSNAFRALQAANGIREKIQPPRSEVVAELVEDYISRLTKMEFRKDMATTSDAPIPVFIVGLPRTGTTLLEKTLMEIANLQAVGENLNFRKSMEIQLGLVFTSPFEIANRPFDKILDFPELGRRYREKTLWTAEGHPYYTDKETFNFVYAGLIVKAMPEARIIHIRRNPMDACFSSYKQSFAFGIYPASYALSSMAAFYKSYDRIMSYWREVLGPRMLEVRYEDLVLRHEQTLARIKEYCRFGEASSIDAAPRPFRASTLSAAQVQKPIHAGNINAWAKYREFLKPLREALDAEYTAYMGAIEGVEIL